MTRSGTVFWWVITPGSIRYPIPEKRVQAAVDPEPQNLNEKLARYRMKLNALYRNDKAVEEFDGAYNREMKTLTLKA